MSICRRGLLLVSTCLLGCQVISGLDDLDPDRPRPDTVTQNTTLAEQHGKEAAGSAASGSDGHSGVAGTGSAGRDSSLGGAGGQPAPPSEPALVPAHAQPFRAPAYPLITHDPSFSIWSFSDTLTSGDWPRHWSGYTKGLTSIVRVDDEPYLLMGAPQDALPKLTQTNLWLLPTRTVYRFANDAIEIDLVFESALLPGGLDVLARPLSYITWTVHAKDGNQHNVALYVDGSAELAVDDPMHQVTWEATRVADHLVHRFGHVDQTTALTKPGSQIDWGYLYHAVQAGPGVDQKVQSDVAARARFISSGVLPELDDTARPRAVSDQWPVIATRFDLGQVGVEPQSRTLMLAYDDVVSIEYMHQQLQPYWQTSAPDMGELIRTASREHTAIDARCRNVDAQLTDDLLHVGGEALRQIGTLAYRQALAAHKLVLGPAGQAWAFPRDNDSTGLVSTVDAIYAAAPLYLLIAPALLQGMLEPVLSYAASAQWPFPFAPHDLGQYPLADGQVFGGGETSADSQMPVEESANMLILVAALTLTTHDVTFAERYFSSLQRWAEYLKPLASDPPAQLTADYPTTPQAHNVNLSAKAILALGAYAQLCEQTQRSADAASYRALAQALAKDWAARADDGDHLRLGFDQPGTWSQKYDLALDRVLNTQLFDAAVSARELVYYRAHQGSYGVALDARSASTKLEWIVWSASITGARDDLDALLSPVQKFLTDSPDRVPMTDRYETDVPTSSDFSARARSVVGGVFIPLLSDSDVWKRWLK